jgi:hypothetical protein
VGAASGNGLEVFGTVGDGCDGRLEPARAEAKAFASAWMAEDV